MTFTIENLRPIDPDASRRFVKIFRPRMLAALQNSEMVKLADVAEDIRAKLFADLPETAGRRMAYARIAPYFRGPFLRYSWGTQGDTRLVKVENEADGFIYLCWLTSEQRQQVGLTE